MWKDKEATKSTLCFSTLIHDECNAQAMPPKEALRVLRRRGPVNKFLSDEFEPRELDAGQQCIFEASLQRQQDLSGNEISNAQALDLPCRALQVKCLADLFGQMLGSGDTAQAAELLHKAVRAYDIKRCKGVVGIKAFRKRIHALHEVCCRIPTLLLD